MLNVIILAGDQPIREADHQENKALLHINGKMMIEYVIDAFKNAQGIGKIVIVGPQADFEEKLGGKVAAILESGDSIMQNLSTGIKYLGVAEPLLVSSCDIPMITAEAINDFIQQSGMYKADLCYPIVDKKVNERRYPEIERTYIKIREGVFTGGNIFYINPAIVEKGFDFAEKLLKVRKNPLKMAHLLGIRFLFGLLTGRLSLDRIEKKFSDLMQIKAKAVISEYPELGNDVDKPSDVIIATAHLSQ